MPIHRVASAGSGPFAYLDLDVDASGVASRAIITNQLVDPVMAEIRVAGSTRVNATYAQGTHTVNFTTKNRFNPFTAEGVRFNLRVRAG